MNKAILWLVAIFLVGAVAIADAQQPAKIPRIGILNGASASVMFTSFESFRQGLHQLAARGEMVLARVKSGTQHATHTDETRPRILTRA